MNETGITQSTKSATLYIAEQTPITCTIHQASKTGLTVELDSNQNLPTLSDGIAVKIKPANVNEPALIASAEAVCGQQLKLTFASGQDDAISQLTHWLQDHPSTSNTPPPNLQAINQELNDITLKRLNDLFHVFLEEADYRLFTMAENAQSNEDQNKLFETKSILRQKGEQLRNRYCQVLSTRMEKATHSSPETPATDQAIDKDMELIDLEEFEDWLSQEAIIKRANDYHYKSINCLEKRYEHLLGKPISGAQLPISIDNLAHSLQDALKEYQIDSDQLPIIYRLFDETVINRLDSLFDILNSKLKSYGVLPNIESQILRERRQKVNPPIPKAETIENTILAEASQVTQPQSDAVHGQLYDTARSLLSLCRSNTDSQLAEKTQTPADPEQLIQLLTTVQKDSQAQDSVIQEGSLSQWLQHSNTALNPEQRDILSLIESIFQNIDEYSYIPDSISKTIKRLETPIAKAAMLDNDFFNSADNPATLLLDQLIKLCLRADMPNPMLEKKIDTVVHDINNNFSGDLNVFTQASQQLSATENHQLTAFQRNTDRVAQTYEGRQRVQSAKAAVDKEINRRISAPQAPDVMIDLIDNGWRELLNLVYIKQGPDSNTWKENLATLDQLQLWITSNDNDSESAMEKELEADSFADLINQKLNDIFPADFHYQTTVEKIRNILKGKQSVTMIPLEATDDQHDQHSQSIELANPHLSRWFKQARSLKQGDEFNYLDDETGQRKIKLAWVSDNQQQFVFVNHRGQKVLDYNLPDLATELSKGLSLVEENNDWPLVERSLYSTVQKAYQKLAFKSTHDELTGLISRKECERILSSTLYNTKKALQSHSLLYLDIDNFSLTNNLYGHVAGDQLLIDVSQIITTSNPENTTIARMAGNEFVILLEGQPPAEAKITAEAIHKAIGSHTFMWQQHEIKLTASTGLIIIDQYTENVVDLLRDALNACQKAKEQGGNRIQQFIQDKQLHQRREQMLLWVDQLNTILDSGQLVLRGQKISPATIDGADHHYEILMAIKNEDNILSSPIDFIEAAECYHRMQRVDRWVIENTFQWLNQLKDEQISLPNVSINLSGNSINDDQFVDYILEQFARYKIPTRNICFEITETATINNLSEAADFIRNVKRVGCKFSLDDFGSGNASYQYLKHLPVDYLKIDGMFVKDIDKNPDDYALVKSINDIAHLMGKKTIAEFAETDQIVAVLKELGVDYLQGYAIDKPTPLIDLKSRIPMQVDSL